MYGGLSAYFQVGEVLAITIIHNATLGEETLTNENIQHIALLQAREQGKPDLKQDISKTSHYQYRRVQLRAVIHELFETLVKLLQRFDPPCLKSVIGKYEGG